jgi:hypothetical protein
MIRLSTQIDELNTGIDKFFIKGLTQLHSDANNEVKNRNYRRRAEVEIMSYTLVTVSSYLEEWKTKGYLKNLSLNIYHLDSDFIRLNSVIDKDWDDVLNLHINEIKKFIKENKKDLIENNCSIKTYSYDFMPAVHGLKLGDGTIYFSLAHWNGDKIAKVRSDCGYIKIVPKNNTKIAIEIRELFDNWLDKAKGKETPLEETEF